MAVDFTTAALLLDVKRRISIPTSQSLYPDSDILEVLTRELHATVVPMYVSLREDYFKVYTDLACSTGVTTFSPPTIRAIGQKFVDVNWQGTDGTFGRLALTGPELIGIQNGYWFMADQIVTAQAYPNGSLRITYLRRPGYLALTTDCAQITAINTGTNTLTCSSVPTTWTTATKLDIVKGTPPFTGLADDQTPSAVVTGTNGTVQFSALPSALSVGDWIAPQYQSPIAQVPPEAFNYLAVCASCQILQSLGALQEVQAMMDERTRLEIGLQKISAPRVENDQRRIIAKPFQIVSRRYNGMNF